MKLSNIIILFCVFLAPKVFSLDLVIPVIIYENTSKNINPIIGSSTTTIKKEEFSSKTNKLFHEILDFNSGIKSRSIYGSSSSGSKTTLDIRGMGAQAKSNVLIMINGQRLNNIDMGAIDFPSIPIDSIARVEVYKGNSASVLYGDGAIGGAINIITKPGIDNTYKNELIVKSGTFNKKELIYNNAQRYDLFNIDFALNHTETDGYRDENESHQNNFTSQITLPSTNGDHFISFNLNEQVMSTPSDRSQIELYKNRRGSDTPNDYIKGNGRSILYSKKINLKKDNFFVLGLSFRQKNSYSDLQTSASYPTYSETFTKNYQLNPRINQSFNFFNKKIKSVYGIDVSYADYESLRKKNSIAIPKHTYNAWQYTQSLYTQQNLIISDNLSVGGGSRVQRNSIGIGDHLRINAPNYESWDVQHDKLTNKQNNYVLNIGFEQKIKKNNYIYGRIGNGFRYPNIDDRIGGSGGTSFALLTQKTDEIELGYKRQTGSYSSNISYYLMDGKNELGYDSDSFVNVNINSTRRYGLEFMQKYKALDNLLFNSNFTWAEAKYTSNSEKAYAKKIKGKDVPLVPQYSFDGSINWKLFDKIEIEPSIHYQDGMRMESDDENFQDTKIPRHFLTNLSMITNTDFFQLSLSVKNIFNEKYHNYAVASSGTNGAYNAYPEPGSEIMLSLSTKF